MRDDRPFNPFRSELPAQSVDELHRDLIVDRNLERVARVARRLARSTDEDDLHVALGFLVWLEHGGDLQKRLDVRGRRGRHRLKVGSVTTVVVTTVVIASHHRDEDKARGRG
jgi:hypothetical protein